MDVDESENNLGSLFPLMTIKANVTHLLHALMMKRNGRSNSNNELCTSELPLITH